MSRSLRPCYSLDLPLPRPTKLSTIVIASLMLLASATIAVSHDSPGDDGLIDGGGNPKTDCVSKFQTGLELNYPEEPKRPKELRCVDGDLSCDADGAVNGSCTINTGLCFADDQEMPGCVPAGMSAGSVQVRNKPLGHSKHDPDLQALQDETDLLLAAGVPCDNPGAGGGNCFQCTANQVGITADLSVKKGKKKIRVRAATDPAPPKNKPIKDNDKLKIRCLECESASTFEHINKIILQPSCAFSAACHTGGAAQGGLNLDSEEIGLAGVYDELLVEAPAATGAGPLGMNRVTAGDPDLGTPDSSSLIYEKLLLTNNELDDLCTAAGEPADCLGENMPPGSDAFSTGKLDLLRSWIEAGAPFDGWIPGATCGEPEDIWNPVTPLAPPAPGTGFQVNMPAPIGYELDPGEEFEGCQWIAIPPEITETWYIDRVEIVANSGTHHIILWETQDPAAGFETPFDSTDSLCAKHGQEFGVANSFRLGAQDPVSEILLPPNTSYTMQAGKVFGFNIHYTNPFNVPIYPQVYVNFYGSTTPTTEEAEQIFPGDVLFNIPPATAGTGNVTKWTNNTGKDQCFFSFSAHQHRRGTGFKIWTSQPTGWSDTNDLIYFSEDWDHPDILVPEPRRLVPAGGGIWFQCEFDNGVLADVTRRCVIPGETASPADCGTTNEYVCITNADCPGTVTTGVCRDCNLNFGFLAEDEMCFMFGLHYAAQPGAEACPW